MIYPTNSIIALPQLASRGPQTWSALEWDEGKEA